MEKNFPIFKYHKNPIENEVFSQKKCICEVCNKETIFIYEGAIFTEKRGSHNICPWCIASGEAAKKFKAEFVSSDPLIEESIPNHIIDELVHRTPGIISWQHPNWLTHCHDACVYLGGRWDLVPDNDLDFWNEVRMYTFSRTEEEWLDYLKGIKSGHQVVYVFQCLHCQKFRGYTDYT